MILREEGEVFLIDKELGWTSFDVVKKVRYALKIKKVGHAGTLDPLASGLLIICAGKKTKSIESYQGMDKEYTGVFEIGKTTPSVDLETEFDSQSDISHITAQQIHDLTNQFTGTIDQFPPVFSAIKIKGRRAYDFARKGEAVKIESKKVRVESFEITKIEGAEISFRLVCSKGFYVRSLVKDFGEALGVGAYLKELRRERIGDFSVENAMKVNDFVDQIKAKDN